MMGQANLSVTNCQQCGARITGPICEYCGTLAYTDPTLEQQKQALQTYQSLLAHKDEAGQINLLRNGFLPDDKTVLIEAGLLCIPLVEHKEQHEVSTAAVARLKAIVLKLKLRPPESEINRAISEFETKLREHERSETKDILIGLALILFGFVIIGLVLWALWRILF